MAGVLSGPRRATRALVTCLALLAAAAPSALARDGAGPVAFDAGNVASVQDAPNGAQRLTYRIGPFNVKPGQNEIGYAPIVERPQVDGWITRIRPDLVYTDGSVPGVDVIHLHHGVWVNLSRADATAPLPERFFAAGEEKTIMRFPRPYAYRYRAADGLLLNHMIHNLTPVPTQVYMVYEIDFIPAGSRAARGIKPVRPVWMDVENGTLYPVFDVRKGSGRGGRYTYPDHARNPYGAGPRRNEWVVDRPGVLVATAGHLHPGGLYTDLWVRRTGARIRPARCGKRATASKRRRCRRNAPVGRGNRAHLFRSKAKYFEPAGAVSWDVAMRATPASWRVKLRRGDVLSTSATYDTGRAAWWESMGIMVAYMADSGPGMDPFKRRVAFAGRPTHGHLAENDNHGGRPTGIPDPRRLPDGAVNPGAVDIVDFKYQLGDLSLGAPAGLPPVIGPGQTLTFRNGIDNARAAYHSITSCKPPCNRSTGIAYPIADGPVQFESGTLGTAVPPATGALEWRTPPGLDAGTYTYFCRIHPFMRGAFRVRR
jgi:plastocyanin